MKTRLLASVAPAILGAMSLSSCADAGMGPNSASTAPAIPEGSGYFAQESKLPFHAPDFTQFTDADFKPAIEQGMAIQQAEVAAIAANPAAPTFDNTIVELEKSGEMLERVLAVFYGVIGTNTNDTLDAIDAEMSPRLAAHNDAIMLDPALFARVKAVYDRRASLGLDVEDTRLLEKTYDDMVHAGALLTDKQKEEVKAINTRLSTVTTEFSQRLTAATNDHALVVNSAEELAGLSPSQIAAAAKEAEARGLPGKYVLTLQNTSQQPLLASLTNRATREALFNASIHRADDGGPNDTRMLIAEIVQLRAKKAELFGQPNWASYTMYDRMAKTPDRALEFLAQLVPALDAAQRRDAALLNQAIAADGGSFTVKPWDWQLYAGKVKKAKYDFDEDVVKPYFRLDRVLEDGVFYAANKLYGLTFEKRTDIPVYHPDVWVYTVFDRDGSELGLFYFDPYQRPSKRGGAWMSNFVEQSHLYDSRPAIYNVINIPKAPENEPQLVSWDHVETVFHEFGHALHGLFADQKYPSISGTATARDFVEFPSQVNETWASDPEVLAHYARHYQTGEPIPPQLIAKIQEVSKFNQGFALGEAVEGALLDLKWHSLSAAEAAAIDTPEKVDAFEREALKQLGLDVSLVAPRYYSSIFRHIFSDPAGYSAGYYSYQWTEMLDRDSRAWFKERGGLKRELGDHFRATVLSRGGTMDYLEMYRNFTGHEPQVGPMLEARGLTGGED